MVKALTGETLFLLVFGTEAVTPVEIGMATHRTTNFDSWKNEEGLKDNLDLMEERQDEATLRTIAYKQRMTKYYNSRVKARRFIIKDLVLKKVSLATQDSTKEKLRPKWEKPYWVIHCNRPRTYHLEIMKGSPCHDHRM